MPAHLPIHECRTKEDINKNLYKAVVPFKREGRYNLRQYFSEKVDDMKRSKRIEALDRRAVNKDGFIDE